MADGPKWIYNAPVNNRLDKEIHFPKDWDDAQICLYRER